MGIPGVSYNFNNQNVTSYQDNFNAKSNVPFLVYFDFETTAPTFSDPERQKMFLVSYVMFIAFHPKLNLDRIIIQRSFSHSFEQLTTLDYFTREQILYVDWGIIKMLKDMAFEIAKRKCKNSIDKMFSIESALVKKTFLKWFNQKVKRQFDKTNPIRKLRYETQNPIDWKKNKCVICKFPLKIQPTNFKTPDDEMSFGDFVIRYDDKFLTNIYTEKKSKIQIT